MFQNSFSVTLKLNSEYMVMVSGQVTGIGTGLPASRVGQEDSSYPKCSVLPAQQQGITAVSSLWPVPSYNAA